MRPRVNLAFITAVFFSIFTNMIFVSPMVLAEEESEDTCADLQRIANRVVKEQGQKITFHGFEKLPMINSVYSMYRNNNTDRLCQFGYMTTISPMGKEICRGHIYTNIESSEISWGIGPMSKELFPPRISRADYCRYLD
jgi:hypothetical protein